MKIKATYDNGDVADVTSKITVTDGNNLTAGKTSVTISYTEGNITKTTTQKITVTAKEKLYVNVDEEYEKEALHI